MPQEVVSFRTIKIGARANWCYRCAGWCTWQFAVVVVTVNPFVTGLYMYLSLTLVPTGLSPQREGSP